MDILTSECAAARLLVRVTSYRDVEEVLRRSRDFIVGDTKVESHAFLAGSIVTLDGPDHVERRRLLMRAIDVRRPWGPFGALFDEFFEQNLAAICQGARTPVAFDLVEFARRTICQTIVAMIGIDNVAAAEELALFQSLARAFINAATVEFTLEDHTTVVSTGREALDTVRSVFFWTSYERRVRLVSEAAGDAAKRKDLPADLITTMILAAGDAPDPELILREAMVFFTAAVNNPVNQTPFGLEDIELWSAAHPRELTRLDDDVFLSQSVQETLRLHRTGNPYLLRRAVTDATLESGFQFRAGDRIALDLGAANHDKTVFGSDAAEFNLLRTVPAGVKPYGLAFGSGTHACIGRPLVVFDQGNPISLGFQTRMLRGLVRAGIRPDPQGARVKEPHAADRYASFGVVVGPPLSSSAR